MKKQLGLFLFFLYGFIPVVHAKDTDQNKNIQCFIQVWGMVKYRSLQSASGKFDADKVFLKYIDRIKKADRKNLNTLLLQMVVQADSGALKGIKNFRRQPGSGHLIKNIDYDWTRDRFYEKELRQKLVALSSVGNLNGIHHYIPTLWYDSLLPNEPSYADYNFDNQAMNLLALAKAWNAVEYLFPYKYKTDENWKVVLSRMIPVFEHVKSRADYEKAVLLLEAATDDTHAEGFMDQIKEKVKVFKLDYYPPFKYSIYRQNILVEDFLSDSLEHGASLQKGDLIVKINGIDVAGWLKDRAALLPASNIAVKNRILSTQNTGMAYAFTAIKNPALQVKILRKGKYYKRSVKMLSLKNTDEVGLINRFFQSRINQKKVKKGYEDLGDGVGIIRAGYFFDQDLPADTQSVLKFSALLNSKKALIFDMRAYPQSPGLFYYYLPQMLGKAAFKFARYYQADQKDPGAFLLKNELEAYLSKDIQINSALYNGKIIILTNEHTQSMGEWFTMMLRALSSKAVIIGSQTAGADGDLKKLNLPGNYQFQFTGNGIFYPNGKETQRIGIKPDIAFEPTIEQIMAYSDAQLEQALKYISDAEKKQ